METSGRVHYDLPDPSDKMLTSADGVEPMGVACLDREL